MKFCAFLLGFLACVSGCSSKDNADPYGTVSEFCEAWGKAACNTTVVNHCSGMTTTTELTSACVLKQQVFCESIVPSAGYSSAQATTCLDAVKAAYSDAALDGAEIATVRELGAPCNHLIKGPVAMGGACTQDTDCDTVHNVLCVMKSGVGACVIPTLVANGTDCSAPAAACNPGFYCDAVNSGACVATHGLNKTCAGNYECSEGLTCTGADATAGTAGKCTMPVDPDMCMADTDCTSGVCDITSGSTTGSCTDQIILSHAESLCGDLR